MSDIPEPDYPSVVSSLTAIITEARVALAVLNRDAVHPPLPDEVVELVAQEDRVQEARQRLQRATDSLAEAGVPFELRAALGDKQNELLAAIMESMWELIE